MINCLDNILRDPIPYRGGKTIFRQREAPYGVHSTIIPPETQFDQISVGGPYHIKWVFCELNQRSLAMSYYAPLS